MIRVQIVANLGLIVIGKQNKKRRVIEKRNKKVLIQNQNKKIAGLQAQ